MIDLPTRVSGGAQQTPHAPSASHAPPVVTVDPRAPLPLAGRARGLTPTTPGIPPAGKENT